MITDVLGREVPLTGSPQRIVSLVPSLTEYLFAIGLGDKVVGVTDFCIEPAADVLHLPKVRGTKNPDRERIAALQPDLILASKEENRLRDVQAFEAAALPVYVTDICGVNDAYEQLQTLAHLLDAEQAAQPLLHELRAALELQHARQQHRQHVPRRVLAFIWRDPWMAIGRATYAHDLLQVCGAENLALHLDGRYPRATLDGFLQLDPQLILLPSEPYCFGEADKEALALFQHVAAVQTGAIHLCDGMLLTWYGPRTVEALRVFGALLA